MLSIIFVHIASFIPFDLYVLIELLFTKSGVTNIKQKQVLAHNFNILLHTVTSL